MQADPEFVPNFDAISFLRNAVYFPLYFFAIYAFALVFGSLQSRIPSQNQNIILNVTLNTWLWALMFTLLPLLIIISKMLHYIAGIFINDEILRRTLDDSLENDLGEAIIQEYVAYYIFAVTTALLVLIWNHVYHRTKRNTDEASASKTADAWTLALAVFVVELFYFIADWIGFYNIGQFRTRVQLIELSRVGSLLALFYFFVLVLKKYRKIQEQYEEDREEIYNIPLTPDNIFQDLSLDPFKYYQRILVFVSQYILFTIYYSAFLDIVYNIKTQGIDTFEISRGNSWQGWIYYATATLIMMIYVTNNGFSKSFKDSTSFWGTVMAFHWDPKNESPYSNRLLITALLFFDTTVNIQMTIVIVVIVPFILSFGEEPVNFVLNLVAVLYIVELDDFPPAQHKPDPVYLHDGTSEPDDRTQEDEDVFNEHPER
uniref:Uncharacterized protein n=1 Tax=Ditylum brightwellii TaxID=49249 RepID=A0A7S4UYY4_9STRA